MGSGDALEFMGALSVASLEACLWLKGGISPLRRCAHERLLLNHTNTPGFLAPGGEEFNPGPEMRLDRSELLCNKVLLKEIEKASDIGIRRGQKEYPLASVNNEVI